MSRWTAVALWDVDVVREALAHPSPDPLTPELVADMQAHETDAEGFALWALAEPWPRFCAIVRIVSGVTLAETLGNE